jgi:hypothetical protein
MKYLLIFAFLFSPTLMTGADEDDAPGHRMHIIAVNGTIATVEEHTPDREATQVFECTLQNAGTVDHIARVVRVEEQKFICWDTGKQYKEPPPEDKK